MLNLKCSPGSSVGENSACSAGGQGLEDPWVRKILREQKIILEKCSKIMDFLLSSKKMGRKNLPECGCLEILTVCVCV